MNDYLSPASRSVVKTPVLKFKDEAAYNEMVQKVSDMGYEDCVAFFKDMDFEGAFSTLYKADMELDKIFDIEDDAAFLSAYKDFQEKYKGLFVYNTVDKYDLSPYLPFTDKNIELVGNMKGAVVIGNRIKTAEVSLPNYKVDAMPLGVAYKLFPNTEHKRWQGKYSSTMQAGFTMPANKLCVMFKSFKKKKLWTRRHPATYSVTLKILEGGKEEYIETTQQAKTYLYECKNLSRPVIGMMTFTMQYYDFTSSCTGRTLPPANYVTYKNVPVNPK